MTPRSMKSTALTRLLGHAFGIAGVVMGANAITTAINPASQQPFPTGIAEGSAALVSVGFIALGLWLVSIRARAPRAGIDRRKPR